MEMRGPAESATRATFTRVPGSTSWRAHAMCWCSSATVPTRLRSPIWTSIRWAGCAEKFPAVPFVLTHLGEGVDAGGIPDVTVPKDFDTLTL